MNDFFTPEDDATVPVVSDADRAKIQAEVFEGTPAKFDAEETPAETPEETPDEPEDISSDADPVDPVVADPEASADPVAPSALSPEMQAIVDSVNKLTDNIVGMEDRIKQTERRVGGITNEFHTAKTAAAEATATQAKAPTPEEMAVAAKDSAAWEDLKKDFPSWATAIKSKIAAQATNFVSVDDFEALRKSVSDVSEVPSVDTNQLEARLVGLIHPDHKQIVVDPVYAEWLNIQDAEVKKIAYHGTTAEEAIDVFNRFKAREIKPVVDPNAVPSEVKQIKEKRAQQLEKSTLTKTNHKTIKQKLEADMTESELREHIAGKVFAKT